MKLARIIVPTAIAVSVLIAQPAHAGGPFGYTMPKPTMKYVALPADFSVTSMSFNGLIGGDTEDRPTNIAAKAKVAGGPDYGPIHGESHATIYRIRGGTQTPVLVWKADKPSHLIGVSANSNGSALIEFEGSPSKTAFIADLLRINVQDLGVRGFHGQLLTDGNSIVGRQAMPVDQGYEFPDFRVARFNADTRQEDFYSGNAFLSDPVGSTWRGDVLVNEFAPNGTAVKLWRSNGTVATLSTMIYASGMNDDATALIGSNGDQSGAWSITPSGLKPIIIFGRGVYVSGIYKNLICGGNRRGAFVSDLKTGRTIDLTGTVAGLPNGYRLQSADAINGAGVNGLPNVLATIVRGRSGMDTAQGLLVPIIY